MGVAVGALNEERVNFSMRGFFRRSHILYVTAASRYHTPTWNSTIKFLKDNFKTRENSDKEVWLIGLDMSADNKTDNRYAAYHNFEWELIF